MADIKIEKVTGTAVVSDAGKWYSTYSRFAKESGYPDALYSDYEDDLYDKVGEEVRLLAKGNHHSILSYGTIYVIESADGKRFIIGADGLSDIREGIAKLSYDDAIKNAEQALIDLRRAAYAEGYAQGKFDAKAEADAEFEAEKDARYYRELAEGYANPFDEKSPQQRRDEIVEKARRDVAELTDRGENANLIDETQGNDMYQSKFYRVEFIVNNEKRTVVALLRYLRGENIINKGIAKCAPNDCFNVHIGKAIALRRALGLDVPTEYLNAPQPTEVRVGDKLRYRSPLIEGDIVTAVDRTVTPSEPFIHFKSSAAKDCSVIIDDSRDNDE